MSGDPDDFYSDNYDSSEQFCDENGENCTFYYTLPEETITFAVLTIWAYMIPNMYMDYSQTWLGLQSKLKQMLKGRTSHPTTPTPAGSIENPTAPSVELVGDDVGTDPAEPGRNGGNDHNVSFRFNATPITAAFGAAMSQQSDPSSSTAKKNLTEYFRRTETLDVSSSSISNALMPTHMLLQQTQTKLSRRFFLNLFGIVVIGCGTTLLVSYLTQGLDRRAAQIVIGSSRIFGSIVFMMLSYNFSTWLGIYRLFRPTTADFLEKQILSPSSGLKSFRQVNFNLSWHIWTRRFITMYFFLVYFSNYTAQRATVLAVLIGFLMGMIFVFVLKAARTVWRKWKVCIGIFMSASMFVVSIICMIVGLEYIEDVWLEDHNRQQYLYTNTYTFTGILGGLWFAGTVSFHVYALWWTRKINKRLEKENASRSVKRMDHRYRSELFEVRQEVQKEQHEDKPRQQLETIGEELAETSSEVASPTQTSPEAEIVTTSGSTDEEKNKTANANGNIQVSLDSQEEQQLANSARSPGYVAVQDFIGNVYAPSYWYLFRKNIRLEFSVCCCKCCPCQCCRSPAIPNGHMDDEEHADNSDDGDEEEAHDDAAVGGAQSGAQNSRISRTSLIIMKNVIGDSTRKKEKKAPLERRWKWFDLIMGFLWWVGSMFFLYMTIVNIGATNQQNIVRSQLDSTFALLYPENYQSGPMCAWDKASSDADIRSFDSLEDVRAANYSVVHCGSCGNCSNWNDVSLQWTTRTYLAEASKKCAQKSLFGGEFEDVQQCNSDPPIGFTWDCSWCWTVDELCAKTNCFWIFLQSTLINAVSDFRVGPDDVTSATCDEALCGPEFVPCSGATRRRMNIKSDIERPPEQQCNVVDIDDWGVVFDAP
eukprot:CAMPEP_0113485388 /NCGR_PEP_ID=MMETSP0014_2-20120614/24458_1 /TAXON_ID=2857 /ORGANISM="Nitzschia sp." /LENGTH=874 /DNA_ID=CAMNT_0000379033 /DNA_START=293 /DNA_END=2917 /DNA_ORIENTATION=+ /assembly_acc=CAM_ASM_000159